MPTRAPITPELAELRAELSRRNLGEVLDTSRLARALYSSDASLYRVAPQAVARPRTVEELEAVLDAARTAGAAGDHPGGGYVVRRERGRAGAGRRRRPAPQRDRGHRSGGPDRPGPARRGAGGLQAAAAPYGLRFGPDPSTHNRCTIGGMIGNNACGPRALGYGKTADNVVALQVVTGAGERVRFGPDGEGAGSAVGERLRSLVGRHLGTIRPEFGRFGRQVSGYSLQHLLPENRFDVARFLAGTEGTLAVMTEATVRLVADAPHKIMVALGYPTMADAGDAVAALLPHSPTAAEGLDRRIVEVVRRHAAARPRCRRCPAATAGCSSSSSATTRPSCAGGPTPWSRTPPRSRPAW